MATSTYTSRAATKIILRHLSGSRVNRVEEFPLAHLTELDIGRDNSCRVRYDPDRDDLVGRHHAKISIESGEPPAFTLKDLGSRNGTYVNRQRVVAPVRLHPGDIVQLGPGGPEFVFDVDPPIPGSVRPTRVADEPSSMPPKATRVADARSPLPSTPGSGIGKATVERLIGQVKSDNRSAIILVASLVLIVVAGVVGYMGYLGYKQRQG
ncbi:MAG: FHA domain-containing protein, partial [Chloracidobacterium sp.]